MTIKLSESNNLFIEENISSLLREIDIVCEEDYNTIHIKKLLDIKNKGVKINWSTICFKEYLYFIDFFTLEKFLKKHKLANILIKDTSVFLNIKDGKLYSIGSFELLRILGDDFNYFQIQNFYKEATSPYLLEKVLNTLLKENKLNEKNLKIISLNSEYSIEQLEIILKIMEDIDIPLKIKSDIFKIFKIAVEENIPLDEIYFGSLSISSLKENLFIFKQERLKR